MFFFFFFVVWCVWLLSLYLDTSKKVGNQSERKHTMWNLQIVESVCRILTSHCTQTPAALLFIHTKPYNQDRQTFFAMSKPRRVAGRERCNVVLSPSVFCSERSEGRR